MVTRTRPRPVFTVGEAYDIVLEVQAELGDTPNRFVPWVGDILLLGGTDPAPPPPPERPGMSWHDYTEGVRSGEIALPEPWEYPSEVVGRREYRQEAYNPLRGDETLLVPWVVQIGVVQTMAPVAAATPVPDTGVGSRRLQDWVYDHRAREFPADPPLYAEGVLVLRHPAVRMADGTGSARQEFELGPFYVAVATWVVPASPRRMVDSHLDTVAFWLTGVPGCPDHDGRVHPHHNAGDGVCMGAGQDGRMSWYATLNGMARDRQWPSLLGAIHQFVDSWAPGAYERPGTISGATFCTWGRTGEALVAEAGVGVRCSARAPIGSPMCDAHYGQPCPLCALPIVPPDGGQVRVVALANGAEAQELVVCGLCATSIRSAPSSGRPVAVRIPRLAPPTVPAWQEFRRLPSDLAEEQRAVVQTLAPLGIVAEPTLSRRVA